MPYDKAATERLLARTPLGASCRTIADYWFSLWDGGRLPGISDFRGSEIPSLIARVLLLDVIPNSSVRVSFAGSALNRAAGADLVGADYLAPLPAEDRKERLRRFTRIAHGAVVRGMTDAATSAGRPVRFESINLPFQPEPGGLCPVLAFIDWRHKGKNAISFASAARLSQSVDLLPIVRRAKNRAVDGPLEGMSEAARSKIISRAAMRFLLNLCGDIMSSTGGSGLDPIDYLLAVAVGSANVSHIDGDPVTRIRYAGMIEPDSVRRPISRAAISRSVALPLETVRRRINRLIDLGVLSETDDGILLSQSNSHSIGVRMERMQLHARLIERMFRELKSHGVLFD